MEEKEKKPKKQKKYVELICGLTALVIIISAISYDEDSKKDFTTYKGTRNLSDYDEFLEEQGIDYKNCTVESNDELIIINEKVYGTHIASKTSTIDEIAEIYQMDRNEFKRINSYNEYHFFKEGEKAKIYFYETHYFTLQELDNSSEWNYYLVQPGDSLSEIAERYNTTIKAIKKENEIKDVNEIDAYTTLKIKKQKETQKTK